MENDPSLLTPTLSPLSGKFHFIFFLFLWNPSLIYNIFPNRILLRQYKLLTGKVQEISYLYIYIKKSNICQIHHILQIVINLDTQKSLKYVYSVIGSIQEHVGLKNKIFWIPEKTSVIVSSRIKITNNFSFLMWLLRIDDNNVKILF